VKLTRVGFAKFRSIGEDPVFIDLTAKANVFIGPNNAGKSNVFRALEFIRSEGKERQRPTPQLDLHKRSQEHKFMLTLVATPEEDDNSFLSVMDEIRITYNFDDRNPEYSETPFHRMDFQTFSRVFYQLANTQFNRRPRDEEMPRFYGEAAATLVGPLLLQIPEVHVIAAIRQIGEGDQYSLDGGGAIKTLASWLHPDIGKDHLEERVQQVQALLRRLLNMPKVRIEVPDTKDKIIVRNDGLRLPLESYGTGIHELLILAIDIYSKNDVIFCIEEPEIHLHPRLQREFLRFLIEETDNRYLLATHSHALMMPSDDVAITHLWLENGVTRNRRVETTGHTLQVLSDLGVAASDLLQANSVIWVEGPSDRVYLNRWLKLLVPNAREGIDYAIMFYGGRLLAQVSMDRETLPNPEDLVPLLRINQRSAIVIDSDLGKSSGELSETKQRVCRECEEYNIVCWVTDGREIENYLPSEIIEDAYEELTEIRKTIRFGSFGRLEQALKKAYGSTWRAKWSYDRAKVAIARRIASRFDERHFSDGLRKHVQHLVAMICEAS